MLLRISRRDAWRWRSVRSRHRRPMAGYTFEVGAGAVVGVVALFASLARVGGLAPDVEIRSSARDPAHGKDTVVEAAIHLEGVPAVALEVCEALGGTLVLIACYFTTTPTGLGATLIVAILVLGRAGSWWRRTPVPTAVASGI